MNSPNSIAAARSVVATGRQDHTSFFRQQPYLLAFTGQPASQSATRAVTTGRLRCAVCLTSLLGLVWVLGTSGREWPPGNESPALTMLGAVAATDQDGSSPMVTHSIQGDVRRTALHEWDDWLTARDRRRKTFREEDSRMATMQALQTTWDQNPMKNHAAPVTTNRDTIPFPRGSDRFAWEPLLTQGDGIIADDLTAIVGGNFTTGEMPCSITLPDQHTCALPQEEGELEDTDQHGTAVHWLASLDEATTLADEQGKLVFVLHVSGNFALPEFT